MVFSLKVTVRATGEENLAMAGDITFISEFLEYIPTANALVLPVDIVYLGPILLLRDIHKPRLPLFKYNPATARLVDMTFFDLEYNRVFQCLGAPVEPL